MTFPINSSLDRSHYTDSKTPRPKEFKKARRVASRLLTICGLAVALMSCEPDKSSIPSDLAIGDEIVAALEKYNSEHGYYPERLSDVVPQYIRVIRKPRYGKKKWNYVRYPREGRFALFLEGNRSHEDAYAYGAPNKKWEVVQNAF